ncbi:hypothetical protein [Arthrobacter sp. ISL-72]|uniref:hypothetical protein n=1 Tax=Arthrobacter sp. ISL-72 TaxID=2819114 RepID=UPI001BE83BED|nr:hypothetical protein [Arthrobacter sp. ISL-72]MBT2596292.1 hypothetical protein [Arthrobacter sp. ISL-72]
MKRFLTPVCLLAAIVAAATPATAAPSGPPTAFTENGSLPASVCGFPISYTLTGKTKVIKSPTGRTIITSPGQKITLVNEGTDASVSYVITGVRRETLVDVPNTDVDTIETVVTGRNIVVNFESARPGLFVLIGEFNYAINTNFEEVRVFSGNGQVIDICAALD